MLALGPITTPIYRADALAVLNVVTAIIDLLQAGKKLYHAAHSAIPMPENLTRIAETIPMVRGVTKSIRSNLQAPIDEVKCAKKTTYGRI